MKPGKLLIRGGGDLASGVAICLYRAGFPIVITELPQPLSVRRTVSFSEAVYEGATRVEEVEAQLIDNPDDIENILKQKKIPVLVDPESQSVDVIHPKVIVDARMKKCPQVIRNWSDIFLVGLGPGFLAGKDCDVVIETNRGPNLGIPIWKGSAEPDTGIPALVNKIGIDRVIQAPVSGVLNPQKKIGEIVRQGDLVAMIDHHPVNAKITGLVRGLLREGLTVKEGMKIGDIDPRLDTSLCSKVSDKALIIGDGVLRAIDMKFPGLVS